MKYWDKIKVMVGFFEWFEWKLVNQISKWVYEIEVTGSIALYLRTNIQAREEDLQLIDTTND